MIQMLSRFDLKPGIAFDAFAEHYFGFAEEMRERELIVSTGPIGRRIADTPMDTDADDAPEFYAVMTFRDRAQLDAAYAYMEGRSSTVSKHHAVVHRAVANPVFTCWSET